MSVHLFDSPICDTPAEADLLQEFTVRLIEDHERGRFDEELATKHYLKSAKAVGRVLRYLAEYKGQWLALLTFSSAAFHIKLRDQWLGWSPHQLKERRHLIAQNGRFLVLAAPGRWPNLASCVLQRVCARLAPDWQQHFGYPVQVVETFIDPQRFRGTCYKAAGWQQLGPTQGFKRDWQDFYTDTKHPKQLWVRPLTDQALEQVRTPDLSPELADPEHPKAPACPVATSRLDSLWEWFYQRMPDPRKARGVRHKLAGVLCLMALAVMAGCKGPHAMAEFAQSLNHAQRGRLRCRDRRGKAREYDVPSERTLRRLLKKIDPDHLKAVLVAWMQAQDPTPPKLVHVDGKVLKTAHPAPPRTVAQQLETTAAEPSEVPPELQKPKADKALMLVNFQTTNQRLIDQIAVPQDTNEEAAVAAHWPKMDLTGVGVSADAAHTTKANCRQLTQNNGADLFLFLKANQPGALAKAEQLLPGNFPPSGHHSG